MASKWVVGGGSNIAQWYSNSIATVWAMQVGVGNTRMIDSCTKGLKVKQYLVKAKPCSRQVQPKQGKHTTRGAGWKVVSSFLVKTAREAARKANRASTDTIHIYIYIYIYNIYIYIYIYIYYIYIY